jgi:ABC-2 type transport system permease protein
MSTRRAWLTVLRREIVVRVTDKGFLVGTLITLLIIVGFSVFQAWDASRTSSYTVAVVGADRGMADRIAERAGDVDDGVSVTVDAVPDAEAATARVRDGRSDAWLHRGGGGWVLTTDSAPQNTLESVIREVVRERVIEEQAAKLGTTAERLQAGAQVTPEFLRGDAERSGLASGVAFAFAFLFYIATLTFGFQLASSVVEEKSSRIVEIIATSIPVRHLLAGKVLGNSVLAVVQLALYAAVGILGLAFTPYSAYLTGISGPIGWFLLFFLAGFVALAALWAVAGSLASRTEEVQYTATPMTMLTVGVFFGALFVGGTWSTVLSFVPPFSAVLMPTRLLEGTAAWWEPIVALLLLLGFAVAVIMAAERLYRRSLLQTGGRLSMRQAWSTPE